MKSFDKRSDVLQAALVLIAEQGFHNAPMAEIAVNAGVATGTIYRYFENKDVLINELHHELEGKIMSVLLKEYPFDKPIRDRFLYLIRELLRYFIKYPLHFRFMEQYFNSPYGISLRRDRLFGKPGNHDILIKMFKDGIAQKILKDLPDIVLFALAFGPLIGLMRDHIFGFIVLTESLIERITEACWDAIER